jgi:hypothetical protein
VCSEAGGGGVLQAKRPRSRVKRSSGVKGEAVKGVLRSRRRAPGVGGIEACSISDRGGGGGVEDLKRVSGKNLLSAEQAACTPDIYIGVRYTMHVHLGVLLIFSGALHIIFR